MRLICLLALVLGASAARPVTIHTVYFAQTHVLKATDAYFGLVGNREALIKVHVTDPATPASPAVTATLTLTGQTTLVLPLTGPASLPASIPDGPGVVQHTHANSFTAILPAAYVKKGLQITVNAGTASTSITNLDIGAPTKVIMTMFDVQFFSDTNDDYPAKTFAELEAKLPVADLELRRLGHVVFPELVIPPRPDVGSKAVRVKSQADYTAQTGLSFDGEQSASGEWNGALRRAAGRSGRWSLYYMNIYNAGGNTAGGEAGGFSGVGLGTSAGILHHELGHALSLPHWGDNAAYPYKGDMHGLPAPAIYNGTHAGPAWAFHLPTRAFIPCTTQTGNAGGKPVGTYKADPMQGGGTGWQEPAYLLNHFSDYSVDKMRTYLQGQVVVWNPTLNSWASWNQSTGGYTTTVTNNGVQFPTTRDTQVISIMASMSGAKPDVNMVYPPIGPYTSGLIRLFDPAVAADRTAAQSMFSPTSGSDYCVRVVQGGVTKTYMLAAPALTSPAQTDPASLETEAINLPASGGTVTKIELLSTPNVEDVGLPANPTVLYTWAPITPDPAGFESPPAANGSTAITMRALQGTTGDSSLGTLEYLFTETSGNPGGTSSSWQTSRSYSDTGLQPGLPYSYTVTMRAGTYTGAPSAEESATTPAPAATQAITVDSTRQFNLQSGSGLKGVTSLGTFDAAGSDKLVVVISTEDENNAGTGYVYEVRYNGKVMTEAIQEEAGSNDGTAAIFYLDNPGAIGGGTIQVSAQKPNGGIGCAYALSNTKPGFGAYNSRTGSSITSVPLTTSANQSLVIAVIDNAGDPNGAGTPTIASPYTQASTGNWSGWGGHASGYRLVATPSSAAPSFSTSTGGGYSINIAAVEFLAQEVAASVWTQTAGGAQSWTTAANWSGGVTPSPASGSTVDFSTVNIAANTTLSLGADRTAQLWKFGDTSGSQSWTVSGGFTMNLAGSTPAFEVKRNTTRLDCVVDGTAGLIKIGAGNLTLTAANTFTGATNINAGTLQIGSGGTTGSLDAASAITNNAALVFNRSNTITQGADFANSVTGTGSITKNGAGTLILNADSNTYTGTTTISAGTLQIGNGGTTGKLSTSSAITNNAALVFNRSNGVTQGSGFADAIAGTGSLTNTGTGTLTLNSANTYGGLTTVSAGAIKVLDANALGTTAAGTVVNGSTTGSTSNARLELDGGITVTGEALTLNGAGNFYGALSSTSGSNTWAGNVTIGSAETRLGATTGNTLIVSGIIDSGAIETGLVIRTQDLTSTVVLSGANTYLGDTNLMTGKLQLDGGNNRLPITRLLTMGNAANSAEFDLNGRNQEIAGLAINSGATAANHSVNNSSPTLATLTVNTAAAEPSSFAGLLKGNLALTKTGADTLTLSAANTYSGTTTIGGGTLAISASAPSLTGGLTFGSANASAVLGTLNLGSSSATFGGALLVRTNSTTANVINIGNGKTLQLNDALTVGYNATAIPHSTTRLDVIGLGTLSIGTSGTPTNANVQIGNGATSNVGNTGILDMSGLAGFYAHLGTGLFRVGSPANAGSANGGGSTVILAANSTIQAATLLLGSPEGAVNGGAVAVQSLKLGSGAAVINVDTLNLGGSGASDGRSNGSLTFHGLAGTLKVRSQADPIDGRATLNVGHRTMDTGVAALSHVFDTTGHSSDLRFGTMTIGSRTTTGTFTGNVTAEFRFDTGTLNANDLIIGSRGGTTAVASAGTGIVSLGGGTITINNTSGPIQLGVNSLAAGTGAGTLTLTGGTLTVAANAGNSIRLADAMAAGGTATGNLYLTGGTLTVQGDIARGATSGVSNATLKLSGGTLDMAGNDIGAAGAGAITLTIEAGTLRNVASINGTGGFTKTTTGTLVLSGTNGYSGTTTVNAGTLVLGANNVLPATALSIGSATLNAATFTDTAGTLALTGSGVINLGAGATLAFAGSSAVSWGGGTLTLGGTFVSGSSLRFGTSANALTATQLGKISASGFSSFSLNASGYLVGTPTGATTYTITNNTSDVNGTCTPTGVTSLGSGGNQTYTLTPNADFSVATLTVNGVPVAPALSYTFSNVSTNHTLQATFAPATTLFWDSNGSTAGFGSTTGTWGANPFWSIDASGSSVPTVVTTTANSSVHFGGSTLNYDHAAVTVAASGVSVGNITFGAGQSTALTIGGGDITLGAAAVITVSNTSNTIASILTGAETSLTKAGSGSLTLTAVNTYAGTTIITNGILKLGASNVIPDGPGDGDVTVSGTLDLNTFSETINGLSGAGAVDTVAGGTPTLTVGGNDATSTFSGNITNTAGTLALVKTGTGTLTLAGANGYSGMTAISNGTLTLSGAGTLGGPSSNLTLSGGQLDLGGLARTNPAVSIIEPAESEDTIRNGTLSSASFAASNSTGNANISAVLTGAGGFTKSGDGTVTLSGANFYGGTTTIGGGTLAISASDPSLPGGLAFGSANASATSGILDLSTSNATFAGHALVRTNSLTANTILIGSAKTLMLNGGLTLGYDAAGGTGQTESKLTVTGGGSLAVSGTTINISVNQAVTNGAYWSKGTLDVSELAAFSTNVTNFNIGVGSTTHGPGDVILSNTANTIRATTLQVGNTGSNNGRGTSTLTLGTGTNVIQADTINIGRNKGSGPGVVRFVSQATGSPGSVTITNKAGTGPANMDIANQLTNATASAAIGTLDLRGNVATVSAGTVTIGASAAGSNSGSPNGTLSFDTGAFDVNILNLAPKSGNGTGTSNATLNIGGGIFRVTSAFTLGSQAGNGSSVATLNLTGGTLNSAASILKGAGSTTATIHLDGEPANTMLDLTGNAIGTLANPIDLNAKQGTLGNIGSINGTGGLTKTTAGTVVLSGTNTYTGDTTVDAGTLVLADNAQLRFVIGETPGSNNRINGSGAVDLQGDFIIDTTLVDTSVLTHGSWLLVEVDGLSETFSATFTLLGPEWSEDANVWTKTVGARKYTFTEATGILTLSPDASFASWIGGFFPGETNPTILGAGADPDDDGIPNAVEMVIGGNPGLALDSALLPTIELVNADPEGDTTFTHYLLFTYRRSDLSVAGGVIMDCETDTDLIVPWTPTTGAPGMVVKVDDNFAFIPPPATDTDRVRVYVPVGSNTVLFGRLNILVP